MNLKKVQQLNKDNKWKLMWILFKEIIIKNKIMGTIVQMKPHREENIVFRKRRCP